MKSKLIYIFLLFTITALVFQYTVEIREPWIGKLSDGGHQYLTGSTLKFSKNWYREGPLNLKFTMFENPKSIEFDTLNSRSPYTRYPPGTIIPIYIISVIEGSEPTPLMVMEYNLLNHFLIAFLLSLIVFFTFLRLKLDIISAFIFSTIPILLELLLPGPLYWHQNVFFADQAVILPFVIFIFLEIIRPTYTNNKRISTALTILQSLIMFYGVLTDWFFIFIVLTVYIKRVLNKEITKELNISKFLKESFKFWFSSILAILLFISHVLYLGTVNETINKVWERTGISEGGAAPITDFVGQMKVHFFHDYGSLITWIFFISLFICIILASFIIIKYIKGSKIPKDIQIVLYTIGIIAVPCFLQVLVFRNHSVVHGFSVLKFSIPTATIPFVFTPLLLYLVFKHLKFNKFSLTRHKINSLLLLSLLCLTIVSGVLIYNHYPNTRLFPNANNYNEFLGNSIQANTGYDDIIFSPDIEINIYPPQLLSYSMKRVYKINSTDEIKEKIKDINGNYRVVLLFENKTRNWNILKNATLIKDNNLYYYIIDPEQLK